MATVHIKNELCNKMLYYNKYKENKDINNASDEDIQYLPVFPFILIGQRHRRCITQIIIIFVLYKDTDNECSSIVSEKEMI